MAKAENTQTVFDADELSRWILEKQAVLPEQKRFKRFLLAFSGGVDSTALVLAMHQIRNSLAAPLLVAHVNHGIQAQADQWAQHCQTLCEQLKLPYQLLNAKLSNSNRKGLEARAREARYTALASISHEGDLLLTGQHADDQSETLLLHLMRGSGVEGLAAIHPLRRWNSGWLGRPLLNTSRQQLLNYVESRQQSWSDDPSNKDISLRRNFLRHKVIPLLNEAWPEAVDSINQTAIHCSDAMENLADLANQDIQRLQKTKLDQQLQRLKLDEFCELPYRRQHLIIRSWIRRQGRQTPGLSKLSDFTKQLCNSGPDARCELRWQDQRMASHGNYLYLNAICTNPPIKRPTESWHQNTSWYGRLKFRTAVDFNTEDYSVSNRQGGENINLFARQGSHTLKKLFQEAGIPPWLRSEIPLLWSAEKLIAIGDLWLDESFCQQLKQMGNAIIWQPQNNAWKIFRKRILKPNK